jgi:hypothetical protein
MTRLALAFGVVIATMALMVVVALVRFTQLGDNLGQRDAEAPLHALPA